MLKQIEGSRAVAEAVARKAMAIAADICVYTNGNLTVERIKAGNASLRNSVLTSYAVNGMIPYRGLGSGIMRVMEAHPDVEFLNDPEGQQFTVIVRF